MRSTSSSWSSSSSSSLLLLLLCQSGCRTIKFAFLYRSIVAFRVDWKTIQNKVSFGGRHFDLVGFTFGSRHSNIVWTSGESMNSRIPQRMDGESGRDAGAAGKNRINKWPAERLRTNERPNESNYNRQLGLAGLLSNMNLSIQLASHDPTDSLSVSYPLMFN